MPPPSDTAVSVSVSIRRVIIESPYASEAEIEAQFKELGRPLNLIEHLRVAPAPLDPGENPKTTPHSDPGHRPQLQ